METLGRSAGCIAFGLYRRSGKKPLWIDKTSSRQIQRPADGENRDDIIHDDASNRSSLLRAKLRQRLMRIICVDSRPSIHSAGCLPRYSNIVPHPRDVTAVTSSFEYTFRQILTAAAVENPVHPEFSPCLYPIPTPKCRVEILRRGLLVSAYLCLLADIMNDLLISALPEDLTDTDSFIEPENGNTP